MCAKKIRYSDVIVSQEIKESAMEGRNLPTEDLLRDESISDEQALRILRARMSWKDWVRYDFARYWFAVASFALNSFVVLGIAYAYHVSDIIGAILLALAFAGLCILEVSLYRKIWPEGILTKRQ
ncbi:MAG: hypothetical protein QW505_01325 [Thermoplasmata archaeon]